MDTKELILNLCKGLEDQLNFETGKANKVELFSEQIWEGCSPGDYNRAWEVYINVNDINIIRTKKLFNNGESDQMMEEISLETLLQHFLNYGVNSILKSK
jgi:hypothetical protein